MNDYPGDEEVWEQLVAEGKRLQILLVLNESFKSPSLSRKIERTKDRIEQLLSQLP